MLIALKVAELNSNLMISVAFSYALVGVFISAVNPTLIHKLKQTYLFTLIKH